MGKKEERKFENLNKLIYLLLDHPEGLTKAEIARRLGVHRSTAGEYVDSLEGISVPVYEVSPNRFTVDRDTFNVQISVNMHESLAIHLATRLLTTQTDKHNPHAASALRKLGNSLEKLAPLISKHMKSSADVLDGEERRKDPVFMQALEVLTKAWSRRRMVSLTYESSTGHFSEYVFSPYFIEPYAPGRAVHVIGEHQGNERWEKKVITLKVERIRTIEVLNNLEYIIPPTFDPHKQLKSTWGIWSTGKEPVLVKLKFNARVVKRVTETFWHHSQHTTLLEDGSLIWAAEIAEWREMLPWIRGWGADVEVLEPVELRKALEREAKRLARIYGVLREETKQQYYAHSKQDVDESEWQLLKDHLTATGEIAFELGKDAGISELARTAGLLHDIGKYSSEFQARLRGSNKRVDHATAGAREIINLFPDSPQKDFAEIISYCIAGHHSGLPDYGSKSDIGNEGTLLARREKKKIKDYSAYKNEFDKSKFQLPTLGIKPSRFRFGGKEKMYMGFSVSFLTRMLFSTLVDADWLETERYMQGEKPRGNYASIEELARQFNIFLRNFENPQNKINSKRTETLKSCVEKADEKPGFFTLTVPTGGGKTYSSMAFALNHAVKYGLKRVIYVIPFTGIIEQNALVFREALAPLGEKNILEHHSGFDWEEHKKKSEAERDDETTQLKEKLKLAAENWDIPIVVTTNVQFFESLFSNKKKSARKLHNIAKSVIIFDEVQTLPRGYLKPSLLAVQELVQNYGASAVFCTATQPALQKFFPEDIDFTELAPAPQELFDFYRRVEVKNLGVQTDDEIVEKMQAHEQSLCIVNTRKHAKGLFDALADNGRFHLSTLMCPVHRRQVLAEIKNLLEDENKPPCHVVSTQVLEAGIDIDFPVGYRALAGLDSIIQAAGRVNREGKAESAEMFVFTPKTKLIKHTPIFIAQTGAVAESTLRDYGDSPTSVASIEAYYANLYALQSDDSFDLKKIIPDFNKGIAFDFKTAAENFRLIENNTVSIIIPFDDEAKKLIKNLQHALYPTSIIRKLQTYTVNIYEGEFMNLQSKGIIYTIGENYHVLDESQMNKYYHPKTGLLLPDSGSGEAVFLD